MHFCINRRKRKFTILAKRMYKISLSFASWDVWNDNILTTKIAKIHRVKTKKWRRWRNWVSLNNELNNYISGCHGNGPGPENGPFSKSIKPRLVAFVAFLSWNQCPENLQESYVYLSLETGERLYGATSFSRHLEIPSPITISSSPLSPAHCLWR